MVQRDRIKAYLIRFIEVYGADLRKEIGGSKWFLLLDGNTLCVLGDEQLPELSRDDAEFLRSLAE